MRVEPRTARQEFEPTGNREQTPAGKENAESVDPNDSNLLRDHIKGQTTEHANPPRLEDEGQSGG